MFSHEHSEQMLIAVALLIIVAFSICYMIPGLLGAFSYITTTFFFFVGAAVLAFGCLQLYNMYKNN
ncbi:MAG: hypothetical protein NVS4B9_33670 [Ktedonobacteraceae bacterium]